MEKFKIFKINDYVKYVLLLSNDDMYFMYNLIKEKSNSNKILVDMFYRNGFSFNRFIELEFNENNSVGSRIINPRCVPESIKEQTHNFFIKNTDYLEQSTLAKNVKLFMIK